MRDPGELDLRNANLIKVSPTSRHGIKDKETAVCDGCGAAKSSSEYVKSQWQYRKQTVPTCRECQLKRTSVFRLTVVGGVNVGSCSAT